MIFKKGDKVYDAAYGWGEVRSVDNNDTAYPLKVIFKENAEGYTSDGSISLDFNPSLSFTEYTLEGFSQERPLPFKIGDVVYLSDKGCRDIVVTKLKRIFERDKYAFESSAGFYYSHLALENPLKNPDTKTYTKEDL